MCLAHQGPFFQSVWRRGLFTDCCTYYFGRGEAVCPVCMSQAGEERKELEKAREFSAKREELHPAADELLRRKALSPGEVGRPVRTSRRMLERNPNRRAVYRMLGIYLPEREARALLRNVHEYKWIEAEKAGYDLWAQPDAKCPLTRAAQSWAAKYLEQFLSLCKEKGGLSSPSPLAG